MDIKSITSNDKFKTCIFYIALVISTYTWITDTTLLSNLIRLDNRCSIFGQLFLDNGAAPWLQETNIALWDTSNAIIFNGLNYFQDIDATVFVVHNLYITHGSFSTGDHYYSSFSIGDYDGLKSYAGAVGIAISSSENMSYPLVTPVAAANNASTSYFAISTGDTTPASMCHYSIPGCFLKRHITFPFTSIVSHWTPDTPTNVVESFSFNEDDDILSINPGLTLHVCEYAETISRSYDWVRTYAIVVEIAINTLQVVKALIAITSQIYINAFKQPGIVTFSNNSPLWWIFIVFGWHTRGNYDLPSALRQSIEHEATSSVQLLCDTFLQSLPMLVITFQSMVYRYNKIREPPSILIFLSFAGSCLAICFSLFRSYFAIMVVIPQQFREFKEEVSQYLADSPQQRSQPWIIFALIDSVFSLLPLIFMISLAIKGFNSTFFFIIPLLIILAKLIICVSVFWTPRARKPLTSPLMFSLALNSPILLLCAIFSPVRKLIIVTATSGVTALASWPLDFVSIDLPILVILIMMRIFGYGNDEDVILLQHNIVLVIVASIYLVWRIVSGLWYMRISISAPHPSDTADTPCPPNSLVYAIVKDPKFGIPLYTVFKIIIWAEGLRAIHSMALISPSMILISFVTYLCFDVIGSLALLISYFGHFSMTTIALYLNSPILIILCLLLGAPFRTQIIAAAKHKSRLLLWKQRDAVLMCSLLIIWPGYWNLYVRLFSIFGFIYCVLSILLDTIPLDQL